MQIGLQLCEAQVASLCEGLQATDTVRAHGLLGPGPQQ